MSEATQEQIDALFAELGIAFPLRNEITIAKALIEARVTLALATQRAEVAEAERDSALAAASGMSSDLTKLHDDVCEATGFHEDALCDEVQRAIDYQIETDTGSFDTVKAVKFLRHQRDRALRILAALREPSSSVVDAVYDMDLMIGWQTHKNIIRAAVKAAEQEVGRE